MADVLEFVPAKTQQDHVTEFALNLDTALGITGDPAVFQFDLQGLLVHGALGALVINLGAITAVVGSVLYIAYQLSQVTEGMANTAGDIAEFGLGMAAGAFFRRAM